MINTSNQSLLLYIKGCIADKRNFSCNQKIEYVTRFMYCVACEIEDE